jgi:N,N'-diacetyllegionaminate synthase
MIRPSIAELERSGKVFVVAEVAQAHDGSLGILHSFIDACAGTKVDAVKFQMHIAEAESSTQEPFRTQFSYVDQTRFGYWQRMGFSEADWVGVRRHCDEAGVEFLATPFSNAAIDLLERLDVTRYKVGSGDVTNALLIERIARTGKEAILSTGLCTLQELGAAIEPLRKSGVAVLQCTTRYPTAAEDVGLAAMAQLKQGFGCPVGLSDHSGTIYAGLAAAALGASVIEAHVTFDRRMFGPDAKASLTVDEFARLVEGVRFVERARGGAAGKTVTPELDSLRTTFGRSIAVNRDLPAGHVLAFEDLEGKKPAGQGMPTSELTHVLGRRLACDKSKWEFLNEADLV